MNTFRDNSPGSRPAWHYLFVTIVIILWLAACGGGSGQDAAQPVVVAPPPQICTVDPGVEHDCPTGAICVGYVTGTSVGNIYPVAFGNRPDWSPDGLQIAFHREGTVYIVNADGSGEYALVPGTEPAWSPDPGASMIAFTSPDGIAIVNPDGSNYRTLVSNDIENSLYFSSPSWSPSGEWIGYTQLKDTVPRESLIYAMRIDGSMPYRPTGDAKPATTFEQDLSWSPGGWQLAFTTPDLAIVDGDYYLHEFPYGRTSRPDWSPDGSLIAFAMFERCGRAVQDVAVIDPYEAGVKPMLVNALEPAWSPDGARLAFATTFELPRLELFPADTLSAKIYVRETPSYFDSASRFVMYDNNEFELQFANRRAEILNYIGNYTQADAELVFNFHDTSDFKKMYANGVIDGDRLRVIFRGGGIGWRGFESGYYVLAPEKD